MLEVAKLGTFRTYAACSKVYIAIYDTLFTCRKLLLEQSDLTVL